MREHTMYEIAFSPAEQVMRKLKERMAAAFKLHQFPVTKDQWLVLNSIAEAESLSQREIAENTFKDPAALTRILDLMEQKNLVKRVPSAADRRSFDVQLSVDGGRLHKRMLPVVKELYIKALQGISAKELDDLHNTLGKIKANLE